MEGARRVLQLGLAAAVLGAAPLHCSCSPRSYGLRPRCPGAVAVGVTPSLVGLVAARAPSALLSHTLMHVRAALARMAEDSQEGDGDNAGAGSRRRAAHFAHVNSLVGAGLTCGAAFGSVLSFQHGVALMAAGYGARPFAGYSVSWQRLH